VDRETPLEIQTSRKREASFFLLIRANWRNAREPRQRWGETIGAAAAHSRRCKESFRW
jgi:hypothetical protein